MISSTGTASDSLSWRKASVSVNNGACLEVAPYGQGVAIRDSKNPRGPILRLTSGQWRAFLHGAKEGEFDSLC
jgi:Domain of unknown function (DUF397)